jgi:hypothetical protein
MTHHRSNTISSFSRTTHSSSPVSFRRSTSRSPPPRTLAQHTLRPHSGLLDENVLEEREKEEKHSQAQVAHLEQLRMLILGMEQRLELREEKLLKTVEIAENEGKIYTVAAAAHAVAAIGVS